MKTPRILASVAIYGIFLATAPQAHAACTYDTVLHTFVCPPGETSQDIVNQAVQQTIDSVTNIPPTVLDNTIAKATDTDSRIVFDDKFSALHYLMFNALPNNVEMKAMIEASDSGKTMKQVAAEIALSDSFQSNYPNFLLPAEAAQKIADTIFGKEEQSEDKALAINRLIQSINNGVTVSDAIADVGLSFAKIKQ